jgi:hypothetical protein
MRIRAWSVLAAVLLLAACGGPKPQIPGAGQKTGSPPGTSNIEIRNDASASVSKLAIQAIADLQDYWGKEFRSCTARTTNP